jgi:hypothetical protein
VTDTVVTAVEQRLQGGKVSRARAFVAALAVGFIAFLATYRLLRSGAAD